MLYFIMAAVACDRPDGDVSDQPRSEGIADVFPPDWKRIDPVLDEMSIASALVELSLSASETNVAYLLPPKAHRKSRPDDWCLSIIRWEESALVDLLGQRVAAGNSIVFAPAGTTQEIDSLHYDHYHYFSGAEGAERLSIISGWNPGSQVEPLYYLVNLDDCTESTSVAWRFRVSNGTLQAVVEELASALTDHGFERAPNHHQQDILRFRWEGSFPLGMEIKRQIPHADSFPDANIAIHRREREFSLWFVAGD